MPKLTLFIPCLVGCVLVTPDDRAPGTPGMLLQHQHRAFEPTPDLTFQGGPAAETSFKLLPGGETVPPAPSGAAGSKAKLPWYSMPQILHREDDFVPHPRKHVALAGMLSGNSGGDLWLLQGPGYSRGSNGATVDPQDGSRFSAGADSSSPGGGLFRGAEVAGAEQHSDRGGEPSRVTQDPDPRDSEISLDTSPGTAGPEGFAAVGPVAPGGAAPVVPPTPPPQEVQQVPTPTGAALGLGLMGMLAGLRRRWVRAVS